MLFDGPQSPFDQARTCAVRLERFAFARETSLTDGFVRWTCGVPAIAGEGAKGHAARGDEYCEYKAVALPGSSDVPERSGARNWQKVKTSIKTKTAREVQSFEEIGVAERLACVFSSTFQDAEVALQEHADGGAMAAPGLRLTGLVDAHVTSWRVGMRSTSNSRARANSLIQNCARVAQEAMRPGSEQAKQELRRLRQAACFLSSKRDNPAADAKPSFSKLKEACDKGDLADDAQWAAAVAAGATTVARPEEQVGPGMIPYNEREYEFERDTAACLATTDAGGSVFRQADLALCSTVYRAAGECGETFKMLGEKDDGFAISGWNHDSGLPVGCVKALHQPEGADGPVDYDHLVVCSLNEANMVDAQTEQYSADLGSLCHRAFADSIVLAAPVRALRAAPKDDVGTPFCRKFSGRK